MELFKIVWTNPITLMFVCLFGLPVLSYIVITVSQQWFEHKERMAMIQNGIDPNRKSEEGNEVDSKREA